MLWEKIIITKTLHCKKYLPIYYTTISRYWNTMKKEDKITICPISENRIKMEIFFML